MTSFFIVAGYLIVTFAIGFVMSRRRAKKQSMRNFFIANGRMGLFAVTAMLFGDLIAASTTTGTAGTGYSTGFAALWGIWGSSFGCIIFSVCFSLFFFKVRKAGAMTGPEAFGIRFNQKIRYLVLIFTLIPLIIVFSTQITASVMYLSSMLNIDQTVATVTVFVLFLGMALLGLSGIAEMNKVHSFVIFFGLTFACIVCLNHIGGPQTLIEKLPASYFNPFVNGIPTVLAQFLGGALGFSISVTSINIGYAAKDIKTARQSHVIVAVVSGLFAFAPTLIGLCAAATLPGIRPDLALYSMTSSVSPELAGLAVMAVFAAIFSTGPTFLLEAGKLIVKELVIPISEARGKKISDRKGLIITYISIVLIMILGVSINGMNVSLLNSLMSASQIKAMAVVLLIFGLYWKRTSNMAGFVGLLVGGTFSTIWYFAGNPFDIQPFWPGMITLVIILVIGSFLASKDSVSKDYIAYEERLERMQKEFEEGQITEEAPDPAVEALPGDVQ